MQEGIGRRELVLRARIKSILDKAQSDFGGDLVLGILDWPWVYRIPEDQTEEFLEELEIRIRSLYEEAGSLEITLQRWQSVAD